MMKTARIVGRILLVLLACFVLSVLAAFAQAPDDAAVHEVETVYLGFKYLYYDFADDAPLTDETAYGPMLSLKYTF